MNSTALSIKTKEIINFYGEDTVAADFAKEVLEFLSSHCCLSRTNLPISAITPIENTLEDKFKEYFKNKERNK